MLSGSFCAVVLKGWEERLTKYVTEYKSFGNMVYLNSLSKVAEDRFGRIYRNDIKILDGDVAVYMAKQRNRVVL